MFKNKKLTATQVQQLPDDLQAQYKALKTDTLDFDEDFYVDEIKENDDLLYDLIEKALAKTDKSKPPKATAPKSAASARYKVGDTFYRSHGGKVEIINARKKGKSPLYQLSDTQSYVKESTVDSLLREKPEKAAKKPKVKAGDVVEMKVNKPKVVKMTWREKLPKEQYEGLEDVVVAQTFKKWIADKDITVEVKKVAHKGDVILINEDGYPTKVLTATMAEKHLRQGTFSDTYVRKETASEKDKEIAFLRKKVDELTGEKDKAVALFKKSNAAKRAARRRKKTTAPKPAPASTNKEAPNVLVDTAKGTVDVVESAIAVVTGSSMSDDKKEAPAKPSAKDSKSKKPPRKTKRKCKPEEYEAAEIVAKVMSFLEKNAYEFHGIRRKGIWEVGDEITGIYQTIGKAEDNIIVKIKHHKKGWFSSPEYTYSLCLDSFKLTRLNGDDIPKPQQLKRVVKQTDLKRIYTTGGTTRYKNCMKVYVELYKCQKDGNCSQAQRKKYKYVYEKCGNLARKLDILPDQMEVLRVAADRIRKKEGLGYGESLSKAASQLKATER